MIDYLSSVEFYESLVAIAIGLIILYIIRVISKKILSQKSRNKSWQHSVKLIFDFVTLIVIIFTVLSILSINGINVGKYFASLGIAGIAIGFAAQDLLKDWIMGLSIIIENYYKIGDVVIYNNRYGKIVSFNIKTTKIKMLDDESLLTVQNRNITEIAIASDWFDLDIPLGYDVDLYYARFICKECCKRIERLKYVYSADFINTQDFEDSWVVYRIRVHCMNEKRYPLRRAANAVVQDVFYEQHIGFPYSVKIIQNVDPEKPSVGSDFIKHKTKAEIKEYNKVYELGSGAAKSKHKSIDKSDASIKAAIDEAERYAASENLDKKMRLKIRLLSEEMLSLTRHITTIERGDFVIERNSDDYEIHFDADVKMDFKTKTTLMEISSDGKNEAYSGTGGSILNAIDSMVLMMNSKDKKNSETDEESVMEKSISKSDGDYRWSLNIFNQKKLEEEQERVDASITVEEKAGMSVLNNLADDVHISVKGNHISITILVSG